MIHQRTQPTALRLRSTSTYPHDRQRVDQDEAAKRGGTDEALYLDRILDSAAKGAVSLLKELPREHLGSLRLMLNQPVPSRARLDIWRLLLKHTAVWESSLFPTGDAVFKDSLGENRGAFRAKYILR